MPQLIETLTGHFDDGHAQLAGSILHRLDLTQAAIEELNEVIVAACTPWAH